LYGDGGGLTLQITGAGVKSWLFRFMREGKPFGMGLGPTHTVSLAEARVKALDARKLLVDGQNPLTVKKERRLADALDRAKMMTSLMATSKSPTCGQSNSPRQDG